MTAALQAADLCASHGHDLAADGWRMCACARSLPAHVDTAPDPAGDGGCGMTWRVCARCAHIDEHHITDHEQNEYVQVQPGGNLCQDVSAGLALSHHQDSSEENVMVEPTGPPGPAPVNAVVRVWVDVIRPGFALLTCGAGDFSGAAVRQDGRYLVETEIGDTIATVSSYRVAGTVLARHHGYRRADVQVCHGDEAGADTTGRSGGAR